MSNFKQNVNTLVNKLFGTTPGDGEMQAKEGMAYSIAGFGQNFICTIIGSYLTVFMTDALGFNIDVKVGALTGVVAVAVLMLVTRLFDAFNDPIMGSVVDRTRTKFGKCRPYLQWMPIPIAIMTILCFLPFYKANMGSFIGLSLVYVVWSVTYTIVDVPYWALSTAMTNDTTKRGNMLTIARMFCTVGAGIVTVFVPMITSAVTAEYKYGAMSVRIPGTNEVVTGEAAKAFLDSSKNLGSQRRFGSARLQDDGRPFESRICISKRRSAKMDLFHYLRSSSGISSSYVLLWI